MPITNMKYKFRALFAERYFSRANTGMFLKRVPVCVVARYPSGVSPVFNLEIEDAHEYFANGVLVHNCVWGVVALIVEVACPDPEVGYLL